MEVRRQIASHRRLKKASGGAPSPTPERRSDITSSTSMWPAPSFAALWSPPGARPAISWEDVPEIAPGIPAESHSLVATVLRRCVQPPKQGGPTPTLRIKQDAPQCPLRSRFDPAPLGVRSRDLAPGCRAGQSHRCGDARQMSHGDRHDDPEVAGLSRSLAMELEPAPRGSADDLDVERSKTVDPERLRHRLLCTEARCQVPLRRRLPLAISHLPGVEKAAREPGCAPEARLQTLGLYEIDTD